jgi:benzoylformate decarboxylase
VADVDALPTMLRRAVRTALTPPTGPVFLALPVDVMRAGTDPGEIEPLGPIPDAGAGDPAAIDRAADRLAAADDPTLVVGDHVARAGREAVDAAVSLAEAAGARVHGEILSCEVNFPADHDQWVSHVPPDEDLARLFLDGDPVVLAGCSTNTTLTSRESDLIDPETPCVHVGPDPWELGKNQPADAAVVGNPGRVLDALADRVAARIDDDERERRRERVAEIAASLSDTVAAIGEDETPPGETRAGKHELVDALSSVAPDALVVDEGVTARYALLTRWPLGPEQLLGNKGGGLGYGLPAAVGAALAESLRPDPRDVLGYVGDGSYLYYPHTLYSAARYGVDLTVVIPDNRNYRILKDNTLDMLGGTEDDYAFPGMDFDPPVDIAANAESHGARGHLVETPGDIAETVGSALGRDGPDVVDVLVYD